MLRTLSWIVLAVLAAQSGVAATLSSARPPARLDVATIDEMLLDADGRRQQWRSAPGLVVITSVLQYQTHASETYVATDELMKAADATELAADLTVGLQQLTGNTFTQFDGIQYEAASAGSAVAIVRPNQVVVARFRGVRELAQTIGFGGRKARRDGSIIGGTIVLDNDFDRSNGRRRLLRTHELGHALGLNHVESRTSIMNPRVGPEVNDIDREIVRLAFTPASPRSTQ